MTSQFVEGTPSRFALVGGRLIDGRTDAIHPADIVFGPDGIEAVGPEAAGSLDPETQVVRVDGLLVAPAIIDLHGDAFERSVMPRPRVFAPMALAMQDNANQVAAAGIGTSFLSATDSWEPGLRSRDTLRRIIAALPDLGPGPDVRVHVRRETTQLEGLDEMIGWLESGVVSMLSFADHAPGGLSPRDARPTPMQQDRSGCSYDEFAARTEAAIARRSEGIAMDRTLATVAGDLGCTTASHDGSSIDDVARDTELGVEVAEFPKTVELAGEYRRAGMRVLLGAPNLVRGGSHLGNLSVKDALQPGAGDVLCSDYHYPSLLEAPFAAVREGLASLPVAWQTVSASPAKAARLHDRGELTVGRRGDVVVVDDHGPTPRVVRLFVAGAPVYEAACPPAS